MPKVTITGLAKRKTAKDHKKASPINKPKSKPGPANAYMKAPTVAQDKKYNKIQM